MDVTPVVSIIMATYNRADLIKDTLDSIRLQSFKDWECIIVDDGSSDETEEAVAAFLQADSRFQYVKRTAKYKKGLPGSRNLGLDMATGKHIIFFDDDDIVHPQNLEICISVLKREPSYFCRYDKKPFTGNKRDLEFDKIRDFEPFSFNSKDIGKMVTGEIPFASCCVMWSRDCFEKIRFNEELMYAEEWECYSRILLAGFHGIVIKEVLYFNRKHLNSNTGEFYSKDPIRRRSYISAIKLVIDHLSQKNMISKKLEQFFIRQGFFLKDYSVIKYILKKKDAAIMKRVQYQLGYYFYPIIRPLFILKGKINN